MKVLYCETMLIHLASCSPWLYFFVRDKFSMGLGGITGKQGQVDWSFSALFWWLRRFGASHIRTHPAWATGIQQNLYGDEHNQNISHFRTELWKGERYAWYSLKLTGAWGFLPLKAMELPSKLGWLGLGLELGLEFSYIYICICKAGPEYIFHFNWIGIIEYHSLIQNKERLNIW